MGNIILKKKLEKQTISNTPKYTFPNKTKYCKVLSVYDGDTITIAIKLEKKFFQQKVRMFGYDSPEMKPPKHKKNRDIEIKAAKKAKKALENKILNKIVKIKIHKKTWDKYGRLLGVIYLETGSFPCCKSSENINQYMLDNNYGYPYEGGCKKNFTLNI